MKEFWQKLPGYRRAAVLELYLVYFVLGVAVILIGSVLPQLREANGLSYGQSGNLLSVQSVGFLLVGLVTGAAVLKLGIHRAYVITVAFLPIGMFMLVKGGFFLFLAAAMFLVGISKGAITDYNNRVMSDYAEGEASPLNSLHIFFAIGACLAPFFALFLTGVSEERGWLYAMIVSAALAVAAVIAGIFVKMDLSADKGAGKAETGDTAGAGGSAEGAGTAGAVKGTEAAGAAAAASAVADTSLDFFREPLFIWTLIIGICDQALESSLMGWMTTYYLETGIVSEQVSQLTTSLLWFAFLVGRIICMLIAMKWHPEKMLLIMGSGTAVFMILLTISMNASLLFISTIGLGLCLSGVYGTAVSNASSVFTHYSSAMGLYVTIAGIGGAAAPAAIGWISDLSSVRIGFCVLVVMAAILTFAVVMNMMLVRKKR
ncbi:MAG: MFS transporter [Eubacteriales bacterium]|nr:MFS transporter [Eubacteriales bacterium]